MTACVPAEGGYYVEFIGQSAPTVCNPGYYSTGGATRCKIVAAGYTTNARIAATAERPCPPGQFSFFNGLTTCSRCIAGTLCITCKTELIRFLILKYEIASLDHDYKVRATFFCPHCFDLIFMCVIIAWSQGATPKRNGDRRAVWTVLLGTSRMQACPLAS